MHSLMIRSWLVGAALLLVCGAAHCGGDEVSLGSRMQALSDGGGDGGPPPPPRLQARKLMYNSVVVADAGGLYDNDIGTPCHPEITIEDKLRCIPDGHELDGFRPATAMFPDPSCSTMLLYQSKDKCSGSALTGRYVLMRAAQPTSSCAPTQPRLANVYRVTTKLTTPPIVLYVLGSGGTCVASSSFIPPTALAIVDLYETQLLPLSSMAQLTETH